MNRKDMTAREAMEKAGGMTRGSPERCRVRPGFATPPLGRPGIAPGIVEEKGSRLPQVSLRDSVRDEGEQADDKCEGSRANESHPDRCSRPCLE